MIKKKVYLGLQRKLTGTCDQISDTFTSDIRDYCPKIPETIS
jgi:hypothetical protein